MRGELRGELRGEMRAEERDGEGHHHRDPLHVLDEPHREVAVGAPDLAGGVGHEAGHVGRDVVLVVELATQHEDVTVGQVADCRLRVVPVWSNAAKMSTWAAIICSLRSPWRPAVAPQRRPL